MPPTSSKAAERAPTGSHTEKKEEEGTRSKGRTPGGTHPRRHEGGVEPLALSCSTDLKSAPRTDEDHHGLLLAPGGSSAA